MAPILYFLQLLLQAVVVEVHILTQALVKMAVQVVEVLVTPQNLAEQVQPIKVLQVAQVNQAAIYVAAQVVVQVRQAVQALMLVLLVVQVLL
jgi:hypothetical protein